MSGRHPSEADLALLAGDDCGRVRQFFLNRHLARCGDCRDVVTSFAECRVALCQSPAPDLDWLRLAGEMRGNIRVGLAAGECVRGVGNMPVRAATLGWKPQWAFGTAAFGMTGLLLLACAGVFLRGLLPRENAAGFAHAAVLQSTGAGVQVRTESGSSMTLLDPLVTRGRANSSEATVDQTITSQGAIRASYIDGNTGTVTVTSVYAE